MLSVLCGEGGIRTPGAFQLNSFQDCRNRPLYHLSSISIGFLSEKDCKDNHNSKICKLFFTGVATVATTAIFGNEDMFFLLYLRSGKGKPLFLTNQHNHEKIFDFCSLGCCSVAEYVSAGKG